MQLSLFLKKNNLNVKDLLKILDANGIKVDLRFIKIVPDSWQEIIDKEKGNGIESVSKKKTELSKSDKDNKKNILKDISLLKNKAKLKQIQHKKKKTPNFLAYVNFVAEDDSHGFVYTIKDINNIENLSRIRGDHIIKEGCDLISKKQIIICKQVNPKSFTVELIGWTLTGIVTSYDNSLFFTDFINFEDPLVINHISGFEKTEIQLIQQLSLSYNGNRITYLWGESKEITIELLKKVENLFKEIIVKTELSIYDFSMINWCSRYYPNILLSEDDLIYETFENDKINIENLETFIKKWELIRPKWITYNKILTSKNFVILLDIWFDGKLPDDFFNKDLIEYLLKAINEENYQEQLKVKYKNLNEIRKEVLKDSLLVYFKKIEKIDNESEIIRYFDLVDLLFDNSEEIKEKLFLISTKDIQYNLFCTNRINIQPELSSEELGFYFKKSIKLLKNNKEFDFIVRFIEKWKELNPELLTYKCLATYLSDSVLMQLVVQDVLSPTFFKDNFIEILITLFNNKNIEGNQKKNKNVIDSEFSIDSIKSSVRIREIINKEISQYFRKVRVQSLNDYNEYVEFLSWINSKNSKDIIEQLPSLATETVQFKLWIEKKTDIIPIKTALKKIRSLTGDQQDVIINMAEPKDLISVLKHIGKEISEESKNKLLKVLIGEINKEFLPVAIDLKIEKGDLIEIECTRDNNFTDDIVSSSCIEDFDKIIRSEHKLIIKHNFTKNDLTYLDEIESVSVNYKLWDTFLVESIMSPELHVLSLNTKHSVKENCKKTLTLFYNQILRYLLLPEDKIGFIDKYLSEEIVEILRILRIKYQIKWLNLTSLFDLRNSLFKMQPEDNDIAMQLSDKLNNIDTDTLVLGPDILRSDLFNVIKLEHFNSGDDIRYKRLNKKKIALIKNENRWIKQVLLSYYEYRVKNELIPVVGGLPLFSFYKIDELIDIESLVDDGNELLDKNYTCIFITSNELSNNINNLKKNNYKNLYVLEPDLISISNYKQLKSFDIEGLFDNDVANKLWMHFSGGQSFVGINKEQCNQLQLNVDKNYSDLWIEKYEYGKYRLFGHNDWEKQKNTLKIKNEISIVSSKSLNKEQLILPKIRNAKGYNSDILRLNPETIFRKQYWVFQKELINRICKEGKPCVLIINKIFEISQVEEYFKSIGFYIPDKVRHTTILSRLEELHYSDKIKKIIIVFTDDVNEIISNNYIDSLDFIWDSFLLKKNYYCSKGSSLLEKLKNEIMKRPDVNENVETEENMNGADIIHDHLANETFLHLKLQIPYITYLRRLLMQFDLGHRLWITDPRVSDFPNLDKWWEASSQVLSIWQDDESYDEQLKLAGKFIHNSEPLKEIPLPIDRVKKVLSSSFLPEGFDWYDYQEEYLDRIIPSKEDLLISLPTGGGKSLLFQAPSLFKSSFTNRLSIVITPLKALMEDQVKQLWDKGFRNNVEYINSDRSSDIPMIYRAMAGGELSLLYVTPERFRSRGFINALYARMRSDGGLEYAIFDEAHCVSQWGHDFRPDYLNSAKTIYKLKNELKNKFTILLFSATVSEKVYNDFNIIFS